jgi:hypothetical protein
VELEFHSYPKTHRLNRDIFVSEKIDGTNACIVILEDGTVYAQSRKRVITPEQDNYGFAAWVKQNEDTLRNVLGVGVHFGEWWGRGINRGYGGIDRRFSLFNLDRWYLDDVAYSKIRESGIVDVVPPMYIGPFNMDSIEGCLSSLRTYGSWAAYGYPTPEGVVIYHTHSNTLFKISLENDEQYKWQVAY